MLFCGESCNANFDEAKHFFELTKESNEIRIFFLWTLEKMLLNKSFANLSSDVQYFFIMQIVKKYIKMKITMPN